MNQGWLNLAPRATGSGAALTPGIDNRDCAATGVLPHSRYLPEAGFTKDLTQSAIVRPDLPCQR